MRRWNVSKEQAKARAVLNLEEPEMMLAPMLLTVPREDWKDVLDMGFTIITSPSRKDGAAYLYIQSLWKEIGELLGKSYYILPSSIEELIVLAEYEELSIEDITRIIQKVNCEQVAKEDQLADHPYFYNYDTKSIEIV